TWPPGHPRVMPERTASVGLRLVPTSGPRRVWGLAFPDAPALAGTGPWGVLAIANRVGDPRAPRYALSLVAPAPGPIATSGGLSLVPHRSLARARGPVDTLIVAGGPGTRAPRAA